MMNLDALHFSTHIHFFSAPLAVDCRTESSPFHIDRRIIDPGFTIGGLGAAADFLPIDNLQRQPSAQIFC